jgi:hypothetical protein
VLENVNQFDKRQDQTKARVIKSMVIKREQARSDGI